MSKLLRNGIPRTEDGKLDLSWKNHYGFTGLIWVLGILFPPLAVAVRFGIGKDFFINVLLTICGIIPGHLHNWFIQNIRNNGTNARTPKWAIRYGLVDDRRWKKQTKKRAWTGRYRDQLAPSERVWYDEDGNAHKIEADDDEPEGRKDEPIVAHKTGLVEPDQWINQDPSPSQPAMDYHLQPTTSRPRSKLHKFKRSSAAEPSSATATQHRPRRSSTYSNSSDSSSGIMTPKDATFSFAPMTSQAQKTSQSQQPARQQDDDIFAHEF